MKILENFFNNTVVDDSQEQSFFIYDLDKVTENVRAIKSAFQNLNEIFFSVKSNPSKILLEKLNSINVNFDVSSEKEMFAAYNACRDYQKLTISGPAKTDHFIKEFSRFKVRSVHIDSKEEYEILKNKGVDLSLRWPLDAGYSQKVGLPKIDFEKIIKHAAKGKKLSGVHIYIGRERAQNELVKKTVAEIKDFVQRSAASFVDKPNLYWGAGLPLVNHLQPDFFPNDSFFSTHLECGRALVHNAGFYVTQVLEVKQKSNERILILNGGLQHLASHFGSPRYGQEDVTIYSPGFDNAEASLSNIYGSLGTTTDLLVRDIKVPLRIKRGDWIAVGPAGGYGYSAGTNQFLGPHGVKEVFFEGHSVRNMENESMNYLEAGVYEAQNS